MLKERKETIAVGIGQQKERRKISRIRYPANGVIVICDTQEKIYVQVQNVSPLGIGVRMEANDLNILGKDAIIVTETLIMYADIVRQIKHEDESYIVGLRAKKFTEDVLQYLFDNIALKED